MHEGDDEPGRDENERDLFEEAMRDVQPLGERPATPPVRRPAPARRPRPGPQGPRAARFEVEVVGERLRGWRPGFDMRQLRRLERATPPPEVTIDLHGFASAEARGVLRDAIRRAHRSGARRVQVIHGRGLRSEAGPVLKTALPGWLAEPPLGAWVLAFASAPPELGGTGATLVLLRAARPARRTGG